MLWVSKTVLGMLLFACTRQGWACGPRHAAASCGAVIAAHAHVRLGWPSKLTKSCGHALLLTVSSRSPALLQVAAAGQTGRL